MADSPDMNATTDTSTQGSACLRERQRNLPDTTDQGTSDAKANTNNTVSYYSVMLIFLQKRVSWISSGIITQEDKDETYQKTAKIIEAYSDEMVDKWRKEIDNLLVFVRNSITTDVAFAEVLCRTGCSVLEHPHRFQRSILPISSSTTRSGRNTGRLTAIVPSAH